MKATTCNVETEVQLPSPYGYRHWENIHKLKQYWEMDQQLRLKEAYGVYCERCGRVFVFGSDEYQELTGVYITIPEPSSA